MSFWGSKAQRLILVLDQWAFIYYCTYMYLRGVGSPNPARQKYCCSGGSVYGLSPVESVRDPFDLVEGQEGIEDALDRGAGEGDRFGQFN